MALGPRLNFIFLVGTAATLVTDKDQSNKPLFLLHIPIRPDREFATMICPVISKEKMFDEC